MSSGWAELALTIVADEQVGKDEVVALMTALALVTTDDPSPDRSIVFAVPLTHGPLPGFRDRLAVIEGMPHGRGAILLTEADWCRTTSSSLWWVDEIREFLSDAGQPDVPAMPVLMDDDPNLVLLLRGLAASP